MFCDKDYDETIIDRLLAPPGSNYYDEMAVLLGNSWAAMIITAALFLLSHFRRRFRYIQMIDLFIFSLLLGCLFMICGNVWIVSIIHCSRNIGIIFHKYQVGQNRVQMLMKTKMPEE